MNSEEKNLAPLSFFSLSTLIIGAVLFSKYFLSKELFAVLILFFGLPVMGVTLWKHNRIFLKIIWPLAGVFFLGSLGAAGHDTRDVLRDVAFALSSIALMSAGYWMVEGKPAAWLLILKVMVLGGVGVACVHLSDFIRNPEILKASVNELREMVSFKSVNLVILALGIVLFMKRVSGIEVFPAVIRNFVFLPVLALSAALSFSRTGALVGVVMGLCLLGWLSRFHLRSVVALVLVLAGGWFFLATTPQDEADTFRGKLARSIKEVTAADYTDERDINQNWRGYETKIAWDDFLTQSAFKKVTGKGFGALVDLGFYINLGGEEMRHIPTFHNGYVYILLKTGALGLLLYFLFYFNLIKQAVRYSNFEDPQYLFLGRLLLGCVLSLVVTMFVVGGMAEMQGSEFVLLLGCLIRALEQFEEEQGEESSQPQGAHG